MARRIDRSANLPKIVIVQGFNREATGRLIPAFAPREIRDEAIATQLAKKIAPGYAGIVARTRTDGAGENAKLVLFQHGDVPDLE